MRTIKQKIAISVITVALAGGVVAGTMQVYAQNTQNPTESLVQKIADRFQLKKADVQKVFDEDRQARQAQMQTRLEESLTQAVKDGKITEVQKQALLAKFKEMASTKDKLKGMTPAQRKAEMLKDRQSLSDWAKEQGIDLKSLFSGKGMMGRHGMMK